MLHLLNLRAPQLAYKMVCSIHWSRTSTVIHMWKMHTDNKQPIRLLCCNTCPCIHRWYKSRTQYLKTTIKTNSFHIKHKIIYNRKRNESNDVIETVYGQTAHSEWFSTIWIKLRFILWIWKLIPFSSKYHTNGDTSIQKVSEAEAQAAEVVIKHKVFLRTSHHITSHHVQTNKFS